MQRENQTHRTLPMFIDNEMQKSARMIQELTVRAAALSAAIHKLARLGESRWNPATSEVQAAGLSLKWRTLAKNARFICGWAFAPMGELFAKTLTNVVGS